MYDRSHVSLGMGPRAIFALSTALTSRGIYSAVISSSHTPHQLEHFIIFSTFSALWSERLLAAWAWLVPAQRDAHCLSPVCYRSEYHPAINQYCSTIRRRAGGSEGKSAVSTILSLVQAGQILLMF